MAPFVWLARPCRRNISHFGPTDLKHQQDSDPGSSYPNPSTTCLGTTTTSASHEPGEAQKNFRARPFIFERPNGRKFRSDLWGQNIFDELTGIDWHNSNHSCLATAVNTYGEGNIGLQSTRISQKTCSLFLHQHREAMLCEPSPRGSLSLYPVGNDTVLDVLDYTQLQNNRPGGSTWNKHPIKGYPE